MGCQYGSVTDEAPPPKLNGSLRRRAARGSAVTLGAQAAKITLALLSVIVLARLIAPGDFGLVVMVTAISGIAGIFLDFGLSMSALRSATLTQQQHSNLFWLNMLCGLILTLAVFLLSWPIAAFYGEPRLVELTQWLSLTFVISGLTAQFRVSLNRSMRFAALAAGEVLAPLLALMAAISLALLGFGIVALVVQQLATAGIMLIMAVVLSRWWPSLPRRTSGMRELLNFGVGFAATQFISYLTQNVDSIAIGKTWGSVSLGFYDRAFRLAVYPVTQINYPMTRIAMPVLSRVVDDPPRYVMALREAQLIACYVTSSALLLVGGVGIPLADVLFGSAWAPVGPLLCVLTIGATFRAIQQIGNWILVSKGMAGSLLRMNLIAQPVIIAFILGGLFWGPMGVAVGGAVGYFIYWAFSLWWAARATRLDLRPLMKNALRVVGTFSAPAGVVAFIVVALVPVSPIWQVCLGVAGALLWYGVMCAVSRRVRRDVRTLIRFGSLAVGRA